MTWSRIERTSPERVVIEGRAAIPLRVEGRGFGWLRCDGERRFVVGRFSEVFLVDPHATHEVELKGWLGVFARQRRTVRWQPAHTLSAPSARPRLPSTAVRAPRVAVRRSALSARLRLPHVRALLPRPPSPTATR